MSDEHRPDDEADDKDCGEDAGLGSNEGPDLSGMYAAEVWVKSISEMLRPFLAYTQQMESTGRAVARTVGPALQAVVRSQREIPAMTGPVLALQSQVRDLYDWDRRIRDAVSSISLPRTLLDQLSATASLFLPSNLSGLSTDELLGILDLCEQDGLSLAWAPRASIVGGLLSLNAREERGAFLSGHRDEVLDDIEASLQNVTHPRLAGVSVILHAAVRAARVGSDEGAQALAGNVLETAMKGHGNAWIRRSFPQAEYRGTGHHLTIAGALSDSDPWTDLTLRQFKHFLVLVGMNKAFAPGATQDTFNRHLGAHQASPDSYRLEFVLPSLLLSHSLLRALDEDLERLEDGLDRQG